MVNNVIIEKSGKFYVYSEDKTKKLGGPYDTKAEAEKRLKQVEFFKNNQFSSITSNLEIKKVKTRYETFEGKQYLVVPCVMLTEGVHTGSMGSLYYPSQELSKIPSIWNSKPVVVYHPQFNGQSVSACDPIILEKYRIGELFNTKWEDGKLKTECWIDEEKTKQVDIRVLETIQNGKMMEVSTGLFTDNENAEGEWNGEKYQAIARNYRPDHLAILPDLKGACSIEDGAGLLRNISQLNKANEPNNSDHFILKKGIVMEKKSIVDGIISNEKSPWTEEDRDQLMALSDEKLVWISNEKKEELKPAPVAPPVASPVASPVVPPVVPAENKDNKDGKGKEEPMTVEQYIANAPEGMRDMLSAGIRAHGEEKKKLIQTITENKRNPFTSEQLQAKGLEELKQLAQLAVVPTTPVKPSIPAPMFQGMGEPAIINTQKDEAPLVMPTMNFSKK